MYLDGAASGLTVAQVAAREVTVGQRNGEVVLLAMYVVAVAGADFGSSWRAVNRHVELSRFAAGESSRLVDNPAPEVDYRPMQHGSVSCFKFRSESRIKLWQKQGGCAKSKRHIFSVGLRGRF